jgi:hypothetical protein
MGSSPCSTLNSHKFTPIHTNYHRGPCCTLYRGQKTAPPTAQVVGGQMRGQAGTRQQCDEGVAQWRNPGETTGYQSLQPPAGIP